MSCVIKVENLSKCYQIGAQGQSFPTLRDEIAEKGKDLLRSLARPFLRNTEAQAKKAEQETLWALKDVSFAVNQGEMIGIVGRNGAGKSTLLKVLSRITDPSGGRVSIAGRMASLLEVGTGFHPELTGRENIFLNGSILGMSRSEIRGKFDQIVAFSEIERFIDTPVKRYSSGMYVRLAFSVAAHLDPDILVVDEVLSVGDVAFQRKCTGTMKDVANKNRTVLFVTHNLQLVRTLCTRAILIDSGKVMMDGPTEQVLNAYVKSLQTPRDLSKESLGNRRMRTSGAVCFKEVVASDEKGNEKWFFQVDETLKFRITYQVTRPVPSMGLYIAFRSALTGDTITTIMEVLSEGPVSPGGETTVEVTFPNITIRPGDYALYICVGEKHGGNWYDIVDENVSLPLLSVSSEERDLLKRLGFFNMPAKVKFLSRAKHATAV